MLSEMLRLGAGLRRGGGMSGFPAPGVPSEAAASTPSSQQTQQQQTPTPSTHPLLDPNFFQLLQQAQTGTGGLSSLAGIPLFGGGGIGGAREVADVRPPEERFQVQLEVCQQSPLPRDYVSQRASSNCKTWVSPMLHRMSGHC